MKRLSWLGAALLIVFISTGCSDSDTGAVAVEDLEPDVQPDAQPGPTPEPEPEPVPEPETVDLPAVAVGVETELSQTSVSAGTAIDVNCRAFTEAGVSVEVAEDVRVQITVTPSESLVLEDSDQQRFIPVRVGTVLVTCAYPALGLIDTSPAELTVSPGSAEQVVTDLDTNVILAGRTATASCVVFDAFGNTVDDATARVTIEPAGEGIEINDKEITVTKTGLYVVSCQVDGAAETFPDTLEVVATRAASLRIAKIPDQPVYGIGQVVEIDSTVLDRFGNLALDATVGFEVAPTAVSFGSARFRFDEEGLYTITARVTSGTDNGLPVTAQTELVVNGAGPDINCVGPIDGEMLNQAPGSSIDFRVRLSDINGVDSVRINDNLVTVDNAGIAQTSLTTRYGINFVDISATDSFGEENTRTCAFLVADDYVAEGAFLDDEVALRLSQAAIDDSNRGGGIDSLGDLLHRVINSQGMVTTLDSALSSASPFINRCVQEVCVFGCVCLFRLRVDHRGIDINGPNEATLRLVNNGLRATATVRDVRLDIGIGGTVGTSGTATLSDLNVDMTFDMNLVNNRPRVSLRNINSVNVGGISTNFSGLAGFVIDILVGLFEGTVRNLVRDQLLDFIRDSFDEILDGVVSGLDINALGSTFNVPRLGGGTIPIGFGLRFSSLLTNSSRTLFGLGLRFTGPINHGGRTLGAPRPSGAVRLDPNTNRSIAASLQMGMLNQALHALWRGGMFDVALTGSDIGAPGDISMEMQTNLPPVVKLLDSGRVEIGLGAARLNLVYPGLFNEPLTISLGALADSRVRLDGEELSFDQIQISELFFSVEEVSLDTVTRDILEDFLRALVQSVVDSALNSALPALPIPSFNVPDSLSEFGIPRGTELGLNGASLGTHNQSHFVVEGNFGTR